VSNPGHRQKLWTTDSSIRQRTSEQERCASGRRRCTRPVLVCQGKNACRIGGESYIRAAQACGSAGVSKMEKVYSRWES